MMLVLLASNGLSTAGFINLSVAGFIIYGSFVSWAESAAAVFKLQEDTSIDTSPINDFELQEDASVDSLTIDDFELQQDASVDSLAIDDFKLQQDASADLSPIDDFELQQDASVDSLPIDDFKLQQDASVNSLAKEDLKLQDDLVCLPLGLNSALNDYVMIAANKTINHDMWEDLIKTATKIFEDIEDYFSNDIEKNATEENVKKMFMELQSRNLSCGDPDFFKKWMNIFYYCITESYKFELFTGYCGQIIFASHKEFCSLSKNQK